MIYFISKFKLLLTFLICVLIYEKKELRRKISIIEYFYKNINFIKYIFFIFNRDKFNPLKSVEFKKFIHFNKIKWEKQSVNNINSTKVIAVESFINHPAYYLSNVVTSLFLNKIFKYKIIGIIRKNDIKSEILFRSFGVKNFIYYKNPNFFNRLFYIYYSLKILNNKKKISEILDIKYHQVDIGLVSYDSYIRYVKNPHLKEINSEFIICFSQALFASDFSIKILKQNLNIRKMILSETQYIPLNIFFQFFLKNKIEIFSRIGLESFSLRRYTDWSQRYSYRGSSSQSLFNYIFRNPKYKKICIKQFNKIYEKKIDKKEFGIDEVLKGIHELDLFSVNRKTLNKMFGWQDKKIAVFFLNVLLDGNFTFGKRKNFQDIYSWVSFMLNEIPKIKNVNWIIKNHPSQEHFKSKLVFDKKINELEKKFSHIRLFPSNINPSSLLKIADVVLTASGSAAVEYPAFGIKALFAEDAYYSNLSFMKMLDSKKSIVNNLKNIHKIKKPNKDFIDKCKVYLFIRDELLKNRCTIIPPVVPSRSINEEKFWKICKKNIINFSFKKDSLYKMLLEQIKNNSRHTINYNRINLAPKRLNDFND
jgi:hypothetical protein